MNLSQEPEKKKKLDKTFNGISLNAYDVARKGLKMIDKRHEFQMKVSRMLALIDPEEDNAKYNEEIVKFVCECAELFFLKPKSGQIKEEMAILLLKPYFNNDEKLIKKFIQLVFKDIRKANFLRRNYVRVRTFFCSFLDWSLSHV